MRICGETIVCVFVRTVVRAGPDCGYVVDMFVIVSLLNIGVVWRQGVQGWGYPEELGGMD